MSAGRIISGKYRIGDLLGAGLSSVVVRAENLQNGQQLAMKLLDPDVVKQSGGPSRLVDEIRVVSQLSSAHNVKVFAVGALESGEPYLVMELLHGKSLDRVLRDDGPMQVETAAGYVLEAGYAIVEAHGRGLVHGALKPSNLFLTEDARGNPLIKVSDFGIGLPVHDPLASGEQHASAFVHAAPEQLLGQPADTRTDVWALGVILFELVSGRPPFTARKLHDVLERGHTVAPPLLRSIHGAVPPGFDAIIRRCLSLHPDHRYNRIVELTSELAKFASPEARERYALEQEPATIVGPPAPAAAGSAPDSATKVHFKKEAEDDDEPPPPSEDATRIRPGIRFGGDDDGPASSSPTLMRERPSPPPRAQAYPPLARPAAGHAPTLASPGVPMMRRGTAHLPPVARGTAAMQDVAATAKLPPQVGAMMNALLPAPPPNAAPMGPPPTQQPPQMGLRSPQIARAGALPPSSSIEWEDAPTTMGVAGGGMMGPGGPLPAAGMPPMMVGGNGMMQMQQPGGPQGGPPLMVAEVVPETSKRTAIIAVLALALLLILPLIYLNSLAKKTTVAPTTQVNSVTTTAMPAYSFQQGLQQPNRQPPQGPQQPQQQQPQPQGQQPPQGQPPPPQGQLQPQR